MDYRTLVCIIVSLAAAAVSVRALLTGKVVSALLFAGVLGLFTPFHPTQFTYVRTSILDMATLALFAASPIIFRKSAGPLALKHPTGKLR
jgi:asparagine N-glycosylation enzyme membrane subunit Stt3